MRNEMAKRVSLRYARQKNLSGISFSEGDWHIGTLTIDVMSFISDTQRFEKVGEIVGSLDTVKEIEFDSEDEEVWACEFAVAVLPTSPAAIMPILPLSFDAGNVNVANV